MRRARLPIALIAIAGLAGCGSAGERTPAACLASANRYLAALEAAPAAVRLAGGVRISACVTKKQDAATLASVGESVIRAATELNAPARTDPGGRDSVRLGYLVGAIQQGAEDTAGIHTDLIRRLDAAARFNHGRPLPLGFEHAYGKGYAAGQQSG